MGAAAGRALKPEQPSDIRERAFDFAVRVIRLCRYLDQRPGTSRALSRQVLRSGTSVGANLEEAQGAHTKNDFIYKNEIALKEARETKYWLRLLVASELVSSHRIDPLLQEADELSKILGAIVVSAKDKA